MHILLADDNHSNTDTLAYVIRLAVPTSSCYICHDPMYLDDFLRYFELDFLFIGGFDRRASIGEVIDRAKSSGSKARLAVYQTALSETEIREFTDRGCHACFEYQVESGAMVEQLRRVLTE